MSGTTYQGTDKLLLALVLAVITFWLFAGTVGTVAPEILRSFNSETQRISAQQMNLAVSITALFSGLLIVVRASRRRASCPPPSRWSRPTGTGRAGSARCPCGRSAPGAARAWRPSSGAPSPARWDGDGSSSAPSSSAPTPCCSSSAPESRAEGRARRSFDHALFGLGLAFYATPSTDAALVSLPADQAGAGAGIYTMASSLGTAIGAAVSLAIFTGLLGTRTMLLGNTIQFSGDQSNLDVRQAGMVVMFFNPLLVLGAILSVVMTVPKGGGSRNLGAVAAFPAPPPQLPLDERRQAVLDRLAALPTSDLLELEKSLVLNDLRTLDNQVLLALLEERRR